MSDNNSSAVGYVVAGVVALVVLSKVRDMFAAIGTGIGLGPRPEGAVRFDDPVGTPELWTSEPLTQALASGALTVPQMYADTAGRLGAVDAARVLYHDAPGFFNDDEGAAISAFGSIPNYTCLLVFGENFFNNYGVTLGAFGDTFLGDTEKDAISKTIEQLRKNA